MADSIYVTDSIKPAQLKRNSETEGNPSMAGVYFQTRSEAEISDSIMTANSKTFLQIQVHGGVY